MNFYFELGEQDSTSLDDPDFSFAAGADDPAAAPDGTAAGSGTTQGATGNNYGDGILREAPWTGNVSFSFPQSATQSPSGYGDGEPSDAFVPVTGQQQEAARA